MSTALSADATIGEVRQPAIGGPSYEYVGGGKWVLIANNRGINLAPYRTATAQDIIDAGKAASVHTHSTSQVTGLDAALAGKAASSHTHAQSDITGLVTALAAKANTSHSHAISDVTGLQTALDGKSATDHDHEGLYYTQAEIDALIAGTPSSGHNHDDRYYTETEITTLLGGKANLSHTHTTADITGLSAANVNYANTAGALTAGAVVPTASGGGIPVGAFISAQCVLTDADIANNTTTAGANLRPYGATSGTLTGTWKNVTGSNVRGPYSYDPGEGGSVEVPGGIGLFVRIS